jgi:hypothetical protein
MIKFEHNMLVLNNAFSEEDVDQINAFADHVRSQERERIIELIKGERVSFDWFQPFVGTKTLIEQINGEHDGNI